LLVDLLYTWGQNIAPFHTDKQKTVRRVFCKFQTPTTQTQTQRKYEKFVKGEFFRSMGNYVSFAQINSSRTIGYIYISLHALNFMIQNKNVKSGEDGVKTYIYIYVPDRDL
jgi:hypothetical protein